MNNWTNVIKTCISQGLNLILIRCQGVGKMQMVLEEAKSQDMKMKYYSSSTLDPWADLVGIPVPVDAKCNNKKDGMELQFIRLADVENAEIMFFDELNRAHPKVINAVLEAIQFHSINGKPLPRLKMVWVAINPPDDIYDVNERDPVIEEGSVVRLVKNDLHF